ncbi:MAG: phosphoribosylglycinamide formyltransferase [Pseudomonadota bacterium]|jgi:phosphoribosylglycinamide formyltransferase-1
MTGVKTRCVVLISGRGSNLSAILKATQSTDYPATIVGVVSNKAEAPGLQLARDAGISVSVVPNDDYADRASYDQALQVAVDAYQPDLVILAGFMRILTPGFVTHYQNRMINIHPSLLPSFTGLQTHQRALDAGVRLHGCTVHFVTAELDHGPIIVQAAVPVLEDDNARTLAARVLALEHQLYPLAVRWFAEGRLQIDGARVRVDGMVGNTASLIAPVLE